MAIKINKQTVPQPGRMTMPKGTYLSNPATAADGTGQGGSGTLPPTPQVTLESGTSQSFWNPTSLSDFWRGVKGMWSQLPGSKNTPTLYNDLGQPVSSGTTTNTFGNQTEVVKNNTATDSSGNVYTWNPQTNQFVRNSTQALSTNAPSNALVGNTLQPGEISYNVLANMDRTKTLNEINDMMSKLGYTQTYKYGVGIVYVPNPNATPTAGQSPTGIYGQGNQQGGYSSVAEAGASLAQGESYQSGNVYVQGGQQAPGGESQYAVTYNNPNARNDKHGRYKMVDYVTKDVNGNFVHVYRQELRKVYTRNSNKRGRGGGGGGQQQAQQPVGSEANQLVTFRANFG